MERIGTHQYRLSTGRIIDAKRGLIGISRVDESTQDPSFGGFELSEGHSDHLYDLSDPQHLMADRVAFTPAERVELADFMIQQWRAFRTKAGEPLEGYRRKVLESIVDVQGGTVTVRLSCGHVTDRVKFVDVPTSFLGDDIPLPGVDAEVYCLQCEAERKQPNPAASARAAGPV